MSWRKHYRLADFFVLRTPLLPIEELAAMGEGRESPNAALDTVQVERGRRRVREHLSRWLERPEVLEALRVASRTVVGRLDVWRQQPDSEQGRRIEQALLRYLARSASRPTPFGLFAGVGVGHLARRTRLAVPARGQLGRLTHLDGMYLESLSAQVLADDSVRPTLRYRPGSGLYRVGDSLRIYKREGVQRHRLVEIDVSPEIERVLAASAPGATAEELQQALCAADANLAPDEARGFVQALAEEQVLEPVAGLLTTGPEPTRALAADARRLGAKLAGELEEVVAQLDALDQGGVGRPLADYDRLAEQLHRHTHAEERIEPFHVDLLKSPAGTLDPRCVPDLLDGAEALARLGSWPDELATFRAAFVDRYGQATVPVAEALDPESGIGLPDALLPVADESPLLAGLPLGAAAPAPAAITPALAWLSERIGTALAKGERVLHLSIEQVRSATADHPLPSPATLALVGTLVAPSLEALEAGDWQFVLTRVRGNNTGALLGRFCHADPALAAKLREHLRHDEPEGAVGAELVHRPASWQGNVVARPVLRRAEVVFLARSGAPPEEQLPISDVHVTVRGDRVLLYSQRLGRPLALRMSNAHFFERPDQLPLYRFLAVVARQADGVVASLRWQALDALPFLPRVQVGRCVLAPAQWRLPGELLHAWRHLAPEQLWAELARWRARAAVPRWVRVRGNDTGLALDLNNPALVEAALHGLGEGDAYLIEDPALEHPQLARGPEGTYVHELVLPLERREPVQQTSPPPRLHGPVREPPGSRWAYACLFQGTSGVDATLLETVAPLAARLRSAGLADRWFFLRYNEPSWHLRVRFRTAQGVALPAVLEPLLEAGRGLVEAGRVHRLTLDTYQPEEHRYGGPEGLAAAEELFEADSDAALCVLSQLGGSTSDERWQATLLGLRAWLADLRLLDRGPSVLRQAQREFRPHGSLSHELEGALGQRFRGQRALLVELAAGEVQPGSWQVAAAEALARRSAAVAAPLARLRELEAAGRLWVPVETIGRALLHLWVNRMTRSEVRQTEYVLYELLGRALEARSHRA